MCSTQIRVIRVALDGSGDYRKVQEAIDAVPMSNRIRTVIQVSPGLYREPVYVPKTKNFITLASSAPENTIISWSNTATCINHHQATRLIGTGTFGCGSAIIEGEDFIAENITFENSAPLGSGQAVAVRVTADRCAFYNCRFLGWQLSFIPPLDLDSSLNFFGQEVYEEELRCIITGNGSMGYAYLGRPWGPFGRVVFAYTWMDTCIRPLGWHNWDKPENERSSCFYEYRCSGPGSRLSNRVTWSRELLDEEAEQFLMHSFIDPDPERPWLAQKMAVKIPFSA
ncbi:hypothetical protein HPP92_016036 [Vanilla planifolia]|uniref:pectinesterase n=1 Tax=Vanilla planifolia TaxID=51239 RepID=A0A835QQJ5_VANPL|nr:hypothetical protein HPP92_016036 [Vanilla planifolia]